MQYMAKWGPKGFLVSPEKVVPFSDFTTTFALKEDSNNDTSGKAKTNTRGRELGQITFNTTYLASAGTKPRAQINEWNSLLGKSYPLFIGGEKFGTSNMKLTKVDISDCLFTNNGKMIRAKVSITLKEDGGTSTSKKTATTSKSSSSGSSSKKTTTTTTTTWGGSNSAMTTQAKAEAAQAEEEAMLALGASKTGKKTTAQEEAAQAQKEAEMSLALASTANFTERQEKMLTGSAGTYWALQSKPH